MRRSDLYAGLVIGGLIVVLGLLALLLGAQRASASDGTRVQGAWPIPAVHCTWKKRGTIEWVHDMQLKKWLRYRCICLKPDIMSGCRWELTDIRDRRPRSQAKFEYDGRWYWKPGWHGHRHWVRIKMAGGGYCFYFWPVWHYKPARLR